MSNPAVLSDAAIKSVAELTKKAEGLNVEFFSPFDTDQAIPVAFIGGKPVNLEQFLGRPVAKRGEGTVIDRDSFIQHVLDHKQEGTTIYASIDDASLTCVFDDHEPGATGKAGWQSHKVVLDLQKDPDWESWLEMQRPMSQDDFAQAIQDLAHTIEEPNAADVRDIVLKFQATQVKSYERPKLNEQSGSVTIAYKDESDTVGNLKLPEKLLIAVSPYRSVAPVPTIAHTRWRFGNGSISFFVKFIRPDKVEEEAFRAVIRHIEEKTGLFVRICA